MPPFAEHTIIDRYTPHPRRIVVDDTPPQVASASANEDVVLYRTQQRTRSTTDASDWSPCPSLISQQQQRTRQRVQFAMEHNKTYAVLHVSDYSRPEHQATWLSLGELKEMKRSSKRLIQDWKKGAENNCLRGLEAKSNEQAKMKRRQNKSDVRFAVLTEQAKQKFSIGTIDQAKIAYASLNCTEQCRMQAVAVGLKDEKEAISAIMESYEIEEASVFGYDCTGLLLLTQAA